MPYPAMKGQKSRLLSDFQILCDRFIRCHLLFVQHNAKIHRLSLHIELYDIHAGGCTIWSEHLLIATGVKSQGAAQDRLAH